MPSDTLDTLDTDLTRDYTELDEYGDMLASLDGEAPDDTDPVDAQERATAAWLDERW